MKNRNAFRGIITILIILSLVMGLSCSFNSDEGNGSATMDEVVIIGKVGKPFRNQQAIPIHLKNTSFNIDSSSASFVKNLPEGLTSTFYGSDDKTQTGEIRIVSATTGSMPQTRSMETVVIEIPATFLYNQQSSIRIEGPARFYIAGENDPYGYLSNFPVSAQGGGDTTAVEGLVMGGASSTRDYIINLENTSFSKSFNQGDDVTAWFTPRIDGLSFVVKNDVAASATSMIVTGTLKQFNVNIDDTRNINITIPSGNLTTGELLVNSNGLTARSNNGFAFEVMNKEYTIINSEVGTPIENLDIEIRSKALISAVTALDAGSDVSSWFGASKVRGLKYTLKNALSSSVNTNYITVTVSGTPDEKKSAPLSLTIPASTVMNPLATLSTEYPIDLKGMKYEISGKDGYSAYAIYDLATYGDVNLSQISPNVAYTKKADGSELNLSPDSGYVIVEGEGDKAVIEGGLSRRGYTLAGFNKVGDDGAVSTDVSKLDYAVGKEVSIDNSTKDITINIKNEDKGQKTYLYAIWDVDAEAWGWTKNADGSYNKTYDISEGGKYFPAVFDVDKAYPGDENKDLRKLFVNYPYYKESKVLARGLKLPGNPTSDYIDADDVEFAYDFVIGEQVITGYMLDCLRAWNEGDSENGIEAKGYEIPAEIPRNQTLQNLASASSSNNAVGYGTGTTTGYDYFALGDKSAPITAVSFTQGMVIANAFTSYYNDAHKDEDGFVALTPAYVDASGDEIKTIDSANTFVGTVATSGASVFKADSTGFRLPTSVEWGIAARILPESTASSSITGAHSGLGGTSLRNYMYPQLTRMDMWSGADFTVEYSTQILDHRLDKYAWYSRNSGDYDLNRNTRTHGFLSGVSELNYPGTVLDKSANYIGVYGMSGNVWEWCDTVAGSSPRRLRGGSFASNASGTRVGYLYDISASYRNGNYGLRLVRLP